MTTVVLLGDDEALLEGLAQMLAGAGFRALLGRTATEGIELATTSRVLAAVVSRDIALASPDVLRMPLMSGGAIVLYHGGSPLSSPVPPGLSRAILAELALPLERHRLLTLLQRVASRARDTGRMPPPPEIRG